MKVAVIFCSLLNAADVLAAYGTAYRRARQAEKIAARGAGIRTSLPRFPAVDTDGSYQLNETLALDSNTTMADYSSNWAGAVLIGSNYKKVVGTIVVPTPSTPPGGSSRTTYYASAWVGLDGDTCQNAILQTGVDLIVQGSSVSFEAWYEWYPDYAYTFTGFAVRVGDTVRMTVTASSLSAGTALIENLTTGRSVSHSFTAQTYTLCQENAEWIVEDFSSGNSLVPFADFGTVRFTDASTNLGGVSGATIIDIKQSNKVLTSCATSGSSSVSCRYIR